MQERQINRRTSRRKTHHFEGIQVLIYLWVSVIIFELFLRTQTESGFFNEGIFYSLLLSSALVFLFYLLSTFLPKKAKKVFLGFFLGFMTLLFASQLIYYKIFKTFYTVFSAKNGGQVLEFINDILFAMGKNALGLLLLFIPLLGYILLCIKGRNLKTRYQHTWFERGFIGVLMILFFGSALLGINLGNQDVNSAYDLYYRNNYPVASVNKLGLLTSMRLDLQRTIFGFEQVLAPPPPKVEIPDVAEEPESPVQEGTEEEPAPVYEEQVADIDFEKLIAEETNENLKNMHVYFSERTPTKENEYTGMFEGYNLILITAEAYSHYAIDKELTPTLYKLANEGFRFTNFYNPIWGVSTSDGEYVATTGLIPKSGVWSMFKSGSISMPYAMGNQLKPLGYKTMAYHNHTFDYYERDISHPNLGYEYKGLGNGLNVRKTWPESDLEMMELTTDEYMKDEPFHAYYMTVSGHMRYDFNGNYIAFKNRDLVSQLPYGVGGKAYMATQIELDKALEHLLAKLEEYGVADKTLIAMSADHYPYGLEKADIDELAGHTVEENFELYKSSFILYAKGMEPVTIDRPVSSLDIIPTISNLMNTDFDSRLLMGVDMLSDAPPKVIFNDRSFITDVGRYNATKGVFTVNPGVTMTEDEKETYRKAVSSEIERQFYYSAMILDTDYYGKVLGK